jgi:hypothetical protein
MSKELCCYCQESNASINFCGSKYCYDCWEDGVPNVVLHMSNPNL